MTQYREILRLRSFGFGERNIANSCGVSRNTVNIVYLIILFFYELKNEKTKFMNKWIIINKEEEYLFEYSSCKLVFMIIIMNISFCCISDVVSCD